MTSWRDIDCIIIGDLDGDLRLLIPISMVETVKQDKGKSESPTMILCTKEKYYVQESCISSIILTFTHKNNKKIKKKLQ